MKLFGELIERKLAVRRPAIDFLQHLRDHPAVLMLRDHDPGGCDLLLKHRRAAIQHGAELFLGDRLQQVIDDMVAARFLRVLKVAVTGDDHKPQPRILMVALNDFQTAD